jgi:hypothetical protein
LAGDFCFGKTFENSEFQGVALAFRQLCHNLLQELSPFIEQRNLIRARKPGEVLFDCAAVAERGEALCPTKSRHRTPAGHQHQARSHAHRLSMKPPGVVPEAQENLSQNLPGSLSVAQYSHQ